MRRSQHLQPHQAQVNARRTGSNPKVLTVRAELGEAGLTSGHDIGVVVEDRERVLGDGARGDVEDRRHQLARDQVEVWDHQQETLRCGEGAAQSTRGERTVDGAGRPTLGLHGRDEDGLAVDVETPPGGPRVHCLTCERREIRSEGVCTREKRAACAKKRTHGRRGRYWIDEGCFRHGVRDMHRGGVAIHRLQRANLRLQRWQKSRRLEHHL